jgi:hypothetical protein
MRSEMSSYKILTQYHGDNSWEEQDSGKTEDQGLHYMIAAFMDYHSKGYNRVILFDDERGAIMWIVKGEIRTR